MDKVVKELKVILEDVNYDTEVISLSKLLDDFKDYRKELKQKPEDERISTHMNIGNRFREDMGKGEALALLAIATIWDKREKAVGSKKPLERTAFVFKSLKHPDEVFALRRIYGASFYLISVYSSRNNREKYLAKKISDSYHKSHAVDFESIAKDLIRRDESEKDQTKYGQNVRDTFPLGDVFIDASEEKELKTSLRRFIELVFGNTLNTPFPDEFGMFVAHAAARMSGSLARQVGAAITNKNGDIISIGMNEVPRVGGGLYNAQNIPDYRNIGLKHDPNDKKKRQILLDLLDRLREIGKLETDDVEFLADEIRPKIKKADLMNLIEFTREVHAEMAAITSAARHTISIKDCILYSTTFPCHDCTKHIVASGLDKVVYIEPYPKSLANELYSDLISIDDSNNQFKVSFKPYVGIAPRKYLEFFEMTERKDEDGSLKEWDRKTAIPRFSEPFSVYLLRENQELKALSKKIKQTGVTIGTKVNLPKKLI